LAKLAVSDNGDPLPKTEDFDSLITEALELLEKKLPLEALKLLDFARYKCSNRNQHVLVIIHISNALRLAEDLPRAKVTLAGAYNLMMFNHVVNNNTDGLGDLDEYTKVDNDTIGLAALVNGLINAQLVWPNPPRGSELLERPINNLIQAMMTLGPNYRNELVSCHVTLAKLLKIRGEAHDIDNANDNLVNAYYLLTGKMPSKKVNIPYESLPFRYRLLTP
jgi:hypothetical protein